MKRKIEMKVVCDKCGKVAPVDEKMSNQNWIVYKTDKPCDCGGRFRPYHTVK